jgi:hypothetical protein
MIANVASKPRIGAQASRSRNVTVHAFKAPAAVAAAATAVVLMAAPSAEAK